jgi:hypothetical protein
MKRRWGLLLALFLLALVVGGVLVARSPRARVRWLELRARSSDRKVREKARWTLFASRPAVEDDEFVELVADEAKDVEETTPGYFLCVARITGKQWSPPVSSEFVYSTKALAGRNPGVLVDSNTRRILDHGDRRRPLLVLGALVRIVPPDDPDLIERAVPLDDELATKIEKLAH